MIYEYSTDSGNTWTTVNSPDTIAGVANWENKSETKFRYGTRYVQFLTFDNYNNTSNTTTDYRNLIFKIK